MRWEEVVPRESPPAAAGVDLPGPGRRWGHTCNVVNGGRCIYVFGGYGWNNHQRNDVHVFDTVNQMWTEPTMKGLLPCPRDSHSCTTVGDKLFVFGGTDGRNPLKDLYILDTSSHTWIQPTLHGNGPDARESHSAALVKKQLFIFGGCGKSLSCSEVYYNDLYILNTETLVWQRAVTSGIPPSPRDSHGCAAWQDKIIILGGEDSSDFYLSDVHILYADTLTWRKMDTSGHMLVPRAGHTTVVAQSNLYVFGGFTDDRNLYDDLHVLNLDSGMWRRVTNVNNGPCARFSVASDCLNKDKGILVFTGGCNKNLEALSDMYYLHTDGVEDISESSKLVFGATIKNSNRFGYEIETIINGKLLHGMIFSCTATPVQKTDVKPHRQAPVESSGKSGCLDKHEPALKIPKTTHQENIGMVPRDIQVLSGEIFSQNHLAENTNSILMGPCTNSTVCEASGISGISPIHFDGLRNAEPCANTISFQKACGTSTVMYAQNGKNGDADILSTSNQPDSGVNGAEIHRC